MEHDMRLMWGSVRSFVPMHTRVVHQLCNEVCRHVWVRDLRNDMFRWTVWSLPIVDLVMGYAHVPRRPTRSDLRPQGPVAISPMGGNP